MRLAYLVFLAVAACIFALTIVPPILSGLGYGSWEVFAFRVFEGYCHQLPERSFFVAGQQMPVCARCFGIYFGLLLGALLYPLASRGRMPPEWVIIASLIPLSVDGFTQLIGLRESTNGLRLATGVIFGAIIPFYLIPVLDDMLERHRRRRKAHISPKRHI